MTLRNEHPEAGRGLRVAAPRLKDVPQLPTAREPDRSHDRLGHFTPRNTAARDRAMKALVRRSLGGLGALVGDDKIDELVRQTMTVFAAELAALPADSAPVRSEIAACARRTVTAAVYHIEAVKIGLATEAGMKLADAAAKHDAAASRHRTVAFDRAVREAAARPPTDLGDVPWLAPKDPHG